MSCITFFRGNSVIHKTDPRVRIVSACTFILLITILNSFSMIFVSLAVAVFATLLAKLDFHGIKKRLLHLNSFMILLCIMLPFSFPGRTLFSIYNISYSMEGLLNALKITLKCNAIILSLSALISTMEVVTLGHALSHLKVPDKLIHIFLQMTRYTEVLHNENHRLRKAMMCRGFQPGFNLHTLKTYANLAGMLLARSLDRSERILSAMKCRGFKGHFYLLSHFHFHNNDRTFIVIAGTILLAIITGEFLCRIV